MGYSETIMRMIITGTVQGVGFRPTVKRVASLLKLKGAVWNDGSRVIIDASDIYNLKRELLKNLPPLAKIDSIDILESDTSKYTDFSIISSNYENSGVSIPTDTAICNKCLMEIRSNSRRKNYAFTTCPDCGARFTLLEKTPYDRKNTSMAAFPMCDLCAQEYTSTEDRRMHHQTICCPNCGPEYYLLDNSGNKLPGDPIQQFAKIIDSGKIGVAKSWGGMHICTILDNVQYFRKWYGRKQKPFAIMVKNIDVAKKYVKLTEKEKQLLMSPHRPIILADITDTSLCKDIAPGLNNIGIFLPYTGMQYILFDNLVNDALIMTSANFPGEPMILDDKDAMRLGADAYLFHNQKIINRADDSVVRIYQNNTQFLRKSRGFIPSFIHFPSNHCTVGIGAQKNLTAAIVANNKIYPTQYIGDGGSLGVIDYLESSTDSLIQLLDKTPEIIGMDLHPSYSNKKYGKKLSEKYNASIIEIQHHWAHAASLMLDCGLEESISLTIDGTGYGTDGNMWGGEVLYSDYKNFDRIAHLQYIPLIGSEAALYDLRRLKFAVDCLNGENNCLVDDNTANLMKKIMKKSVKTSSLGRFLDTIAFTLNICSKRTYDGEPAMKIEPYLSKGKYIEGFETETVNGTIMTTHLFQDIPKNTGKEDIAYSIVKCVIDELTNDACDVALSKGISKIGLTGGVSYNRPICDMFSTAVKNRGMEPVFHNKIPNGDGGISAGQAAIASKSLD
ncbi:MAG: carbamoyltransferase HypF [archaeon]|nr:carbamoyltransferase HypF [archaeon]